MDEQCVKHILVAEDDENMRQALVFVLESAGYKVTTAEDGKYAMQQLMDQSGSEDRFDMLITDLQMPRLLGLDLIGMLEQRNISMPVIVISGYSDKQTMIELIRVGCSDFLEKPFTPQKVLERVTEVSHKWFEARQKQLKKEHKLQQQLNDLRRLLASYEQRYSEILQSCSLNPVSSYEKPTAPLAAEGFAGEAVVSKEDAQEVAVANDEVEPQEQDTEPVAAVHADVPVLLEERDGDWLVITPQPHLDDEFTPEFCQKLATYLDDGEDHFKFDLSRLPDMGAKVLAVFAALASTLQGTGGNYGLQISACSEKIANLFRLTALNISYSLPQ